MDNLQNKGLQELQDAFDEFNIAYEKARKSQLKALDVLKELFEPGSGDAKDQQTENEVNDELLKKAEREQEEELIKEENENIERCDNVIPH